MALTSMSPFWDRFPDVAAQETRVISLRYPQGGLSVGSFGFLELYCADPACDCRRVVLQVRSEDQPEKILATINYGWEDIAFFTQWLHGDRETARETQEVSLDPINP